MQGSFINNEVKNGGKTEMMKKISNLTIFIAVFTVLGLAIIADVPAAERIPGNGRQKIRKRRL